ncbi:MAG: hypothetical protein LBU76_08495 [Azoarcus sp.]|jgi:hypothetical protein|nr:hypothetical protein [Azoarcus sp.]
MRCGAPLQAAPIEQAAATPQPDNESTVRMSAQNMPRTAQKPLPALLSVPRTNRFLQEPISAALPQPDTLAVELSNAPTMIFPNRDKLAEFELLQELIPAAPLLPNALALDTSNAPTMIFSGNQNPQFPSKKQDRKARGQARRSAQMPDTPTEPFISSFPAIETAQNKSPEPAVPPIAGAFPPILLEKDELIVADLLSGSPLPQQAFREGIHPALPVIAVFALIVCLAGFFLWDSGETGRSPESAETSLPTQPSEPLPDDAAPASAASAPEPEPELKPEPKDVSASNSEPEPGQELMDIPSLPTNQRQGRHNQFNPAEIIESELPSAALP